jgi:16S rRNA (guanine1207-N2)-methyltransferase
MPQEHYFTNDPNAEFKPKSISVTLAGREVSVLTAGSMFSPDHVDTGTKVLLENLELAPDDGNILDIGCGWGPIALALAIARPEATVWAIDVNERALELTRQNAERLGLTNIKTARPDAVPADISFNGIWSNPPIRVGKEVLHEIMQTWLPRLVIGGDAYLVVQKNLGSDSLLKWLQDTMTSFESSRLETAKSFRVLQVTREG